MSKIWPFLLKNQVFGCFLENRLSEFHVTWSETWDNCFNHLTVVLCLGKFLFWPFWPIFGQKYIACGDKLRFLTFFDQFLPICWCLFDNFCFLNQVYGLRRDKVSLGCDKKFFGHFLTFFSPKFGHFCSKIRFLAVFLKTAYQNFT